MLLLLLSSLLCFLYPYRLVNPNDSPFFNNVFSLSSSSCSSLSFSLSIWSVFVRGGSLPIFIAFIERSHKTTNESNELRSEKKAARKEKNYATFGGFSIVRVCKQVWVKEEATRKMNDSWMLSNIWILYILVVILDVDFIVLFLYVCVCESSHFNSSNVKVLPLVFISRFTKKEVTKPKCLAFEIFITNQPSTQTTGKKIHIDNCSTKYIVLDMPSYFLAVTKIKAVRLRVKLKSQLFVKWTWRSTQRDTHKKRIKTFHWIYDKNPFCHMGNEISFI